MRVVLYCVVHVLRVLYCVLCVMLCDAAMLVLLCVLCVGHTENKFKGPIKLNVGGVVFVTTLTTLSKQESMLKAMFSGNHTLEVSTNT